MDDTDEQEPLPPSKSQRKREADAIRQLGVELAELGDSDRARIALPDTVRDAIELLNRTTQRSAHKRQLGFLAKHLRQIDVEPIQAALEHKRQMARANSQQHHRVERWRDRLVGLDPAMTPADALTELIERYPLANRQQVRQLQRKALTEQQGDQTPRATRQLFKVLRTLIIDSSAADPT